MLTSRKINSPKSSIRRCIHGSVSLKNTRAPHATEHAHTPPKGMSEIERPQLPDNERADAEDIAEENRVCSCLAWDIEHGSDGILFRNLYTTFSRHLLRSGKRSSISSNLESINRRHRRHFRYWENLGNWTDCWVHHCLRYSGTKTISETFSEKTSQHTFYSLQLSRIIPHSWTPIRSISLL